MTVALPTVEQRPGITPPARESFDTMTIDNSNEKTPGVSLRPARNTFKTLFIY